MNVADRELRPRFPVAVRLVTLVAFVWFAVPTVLLGDIAPNPLRGGVNFSGSTDQVRMSEESVTLKVSATRCATNAVFQMKNLTAVDVRMEVGFPFAYPDDLRDFGVKVDGKPIQNVVEDTLGRKRKWKVWTMTFPAGAESKVEVNYWNELQADYSWVLGFESVPDLLLGLTPYKQKPKGQATEADQREHNELARRLRHMQVGYILTTGAGWAGTIGKCRIEAQFDGFSTESLITRFPLANKDYLPRDPQVERDKLVWVLTDFEPKHDISFQISPNITRTELKELIEANLKQRPHHSLLIRVFGDSCDSPQEIKRHEQLVDEMIAAWSKRFAVEGPDYVDREHAQQSIRVWFTVRELTFQRREQPPLGDERKKKLLPAFKEIAQRLKAQMPPVGTSRTEHLNEYQVKTFRQESEQMLKWVDDQR